MEARASGSTGDEQGGDGGWQDKWRGGEEATAPHQSRRGRTIRLPPPAVSYRYRSSVCTAATPAIGSAGADGRGAGLGAVPERAAASHAAWDESRAPAASSTCGRMQRARKGRAAAGTVRRRTKTKLGSRGRGRTSGRQRVARSRVARRAAPQASPLGVREKVASPLAPCIRVELRITGRAS